MRIDLLLLTLLCSIISVQADQDIIEYAAIHPRGEETVKQIDGTYKKSSYGDYQLDEAVAFLSASHPRPWTVAEALHWFDSATDDESRVHTLRLLAASRDPKAALALHSATNSKSLKVRMAAYYGLADYFLPETENGGTEQIIQATQEWFVSNKQRLDKEAEAR